MNQPSYCCIRAPKNEPGGSDPQGEENIMDGKIQDLCFPKCLQ